MGLTYSDFKLLADYQSAKEQTAIRAGAKGFDIWVEGDLLLDGAVLSSTGEKWWNLLNTHTVTMRDQINHANVSGKSEQLTLQYTATYNNDGQSTGGAFGGSGYGMARIDRKTLGHTKAGISDAMININREDLQYQKLYGAGSGQAVPPTPYDAKRAQAQQLLAQELAAQAACTTTACALAARQAVGMARDAVYRQESSQKAWLITQFKNGLNQDVNKAHLPVSPDFVDPTKVTSELKTQAAVMAAFTKNGYQAAGTYAQNRLDEASKKREQAGQTEDEATRRRLTNEADDLVRLWGPSGPARAALHALVGGAALGVAGSVSSATNVLAADQLTSAVQTAMASVGLTPGDNVSLYNALRGVASTVLGAAVGGAQGAAATFNADANNCSVSCDHIPRRSWALFRARDVMRGVIESFKAEQAA